MTLFGVQRSPRIVLFGCGQRAAIGHVARECGSRVFVCSDVRIEADALLRGVLATLTAAGLTVEVYAETQPELPLDCILQATERARAFRPDMVIGLGGGSCLDLAKLVSAGVSYTTPVQSWYGEFKIPGPVLPVIAVPTTSGTGSEATPVAVLGDPARALKVGVSSPHLIPFAAICDPELTLTCPPALTAISGADALTHAIEAFTAFRREPTGSLASEHVFVGKNILSDAQAEIAIKALIHHLPTAVRDGTNLAAREQVMLGAYTAGCAFGAAGTAAAHAIQYPIGALTHTAHGLGVAVLLPYVLRFNRNFCEPELAAIGRMIGLRGANEGALADQTILTIDTLFEAIGIPHALGELGVTADKLDWIAEQSFGITRLVKNNPRPLDLAGVATIVNAAFNGDRGSVRKIDRVSHA